MKFMNALFSACPLVSASALKTLCLNGEPSFLSFSTSCNIFNVNIHFPRRKSTLSLNDLMWARSVSWQITLAVESAVGNLTLEFSSAIASSQVFITPSHPMASTIRSNSSARSRQSSLDLPYLCFEMVAARWFRSSTHSSWEPKWVGGIQSILRLFRDSWWSWSDASSDISSGTRRRLIRSGLFGGNTIFKICRSLLPWRSNSRRRSR